jgi:hypothetical protein
MKAFDIIFHKTVDQFIILIYSKICHIGIKLEKNKITWNIQTLRGPDPH